MEEILEKINLDKELLSVYPQNNMKNIGKYKEKLLEIKEEYEKYEKELTEEITTRVNFIMKADMNKEIEKVKIQKEEIERNLYLLDKTMTSYEKMGLDKSILKLRRFYKENLDVINTEIIKVLNKFKSVGINLGVSDFELNKYVKRYIKCFLEEKDILNSNIVKQEFEEIYWKCPDLLIYIRLIFEQLYMKNEKQIDKYYELKKEEYLKSVGKTEKELLEEYNLLNRMYIELNLEDKKLILDKFYNEELKVQVYSDDNVKNNYLKFIPQELLTIDNKELKDEIDTNLLKLSNSLYEYKEYLKFKFIIDDIKEKISLEEEKGKDEIKDTLNEIKKEEAKIEKISKNINKKGILKASDKKKEIMNEEYNKIILKLSELYQNLNKLKMEKKIKNTITKNTTIYGALKIVSAFYEYINDCRYNKEKDEEVSKEELEDFYYELQEYIRWPYFTIINNISISDENTITRVIHDIYKLLEIEISEESLSQENLDNLISSIEVIKQNYYIEKAGIDKQQIRDMEKFRKTLK